MAIKYDKGDKVVITDKLSSDVYDRDSMVGQECVIEQVCKITDNVTLYRLDKFPTTYFAGTVLRPVY